MAAPMEIEAGGPAPALKRCSSAPLIGPPQRATPEIVSTTVKNPQLRLQLQPQPARTRRFSTSFSPLPQAHSPVSLPFSIVSIFPYVICRSPTEFIGATTDSSREPVESIMGRFDVDDRRRQRFHWTRLTDAR
jgi:hypothetical protein